jgi:hypothetical protein
LALALLPPMLQAGQLRPRAASRSAWRTVGSHWLMFFQLPAMQSKSLQPSTACAGALSPSQRLRTRPEQAASRTKRTNRLNCDEGWITVLKCVFIANLILDVKSWRHTVAEKDNVAEKNVH